MTSREEKEDFICDLIQAALKPRQFQMSSRHFQALRRMCDRHSNMFDRVFNAFDMFLNDVILWFKTYKFKFNDRRLSYKIMLFT